MAIIKTKNKTFHAKPLWDEWIWSTKFTLPIGEHPILYRYYIDSVEVTKEKFEAEYAKESV